MDKRFRQIAAEMEGMPLSEVLDYAVAELKKAHAANQKERVEIERLKAETKVLGEETRALLEEIHAGLAALRAASAGELKGVHRSRSAPDVRNLG